MARKTRRKKRPKRTDRYVRVNATIEPAQAKAVSDWQEEHDCASWSHALRQMLRALIEAREDGRL